ncbi:MAG: hypothetical protein P4L57_15965 [Rhizomicrobium sp.]|nr:hypothetical protein [Rhizomicrobium sp.]
MGSKCIVTEVPNRLGQLLRKPGGISRGLALKAADTNVERLREEFVAAIPAEIAALEAILAASGGQSIAVSDLDAMLGRASQILTLSGTYDFDRLDTVVKRFCDLVIGMIDKGIRDVAPVSVFLRAMRMVAPGAAEISETELTHILEGLASVQNYYGIVRKPIVQAG